MLFTIVPSSTYVDIPAGSYKAKFESVSPFDTKNGAALLWKFKAEDGRLISGLSDAVNPPSPKNKTGRWLAALCNKPSIAGLQVNPDDYVGKSYLVIMVAKESGTRLDTFVQVA